VAPRRPAIEIVVAEAMDIPIAPLAPLLVTNLCNRLGAKPGNQYASEGDP
jgi:hypothetical protein